MWLGRHSKGQVVHLLALKFFYVSDVGGMRCLFAGAMHAIKTWLFRDQFQMTASEKRGIRDLGTLEVIIHLKTPIGVETPLNGFKLMIELLKYTHDAIFPHSKQNAWTSSMVPY